MITRAAQLCVEVTQKCKDVTVRRSRDQTQFTTCFAIHILPFNPTSTEAEEKLLPSSSFFRGVKSKMN